MIVRISDQIDFLAHSSSGSLPKCHKRSWVKMTWLHPKHSKIPSPKPILLHLLPGEIACGLPPGFRHFSDAKFRPLQRFALNCPWNLIPTCRQVFEVQKYAFKGFPGLVLSCCETCFFKGFFLGKAKRPGFLGELQKISNIFTSEFKLVGEWDFFQEIFFNGRCVAFTFSHVVQRKLGKEITWATLTYRVFWKIACLNNQRDVLEILHFWLWKRIGFDSALRLWRGIFPLCVFLKALIYLPWRLFERNPQQGSIIGKCQLKILHSSGKIQPLGNEQLPPICWNL